LRIEPYLLATGAKHPELWGFIMDEAERLGATKECLVHGDFSPKNILVSPNRMVLLDCEVAWYGDPAFDVAFLLNHFFLKALLHAPRAAGMRAMIECFWKEYQAIWPAPAVEGRVCWLLPMLMLARVDGKSPVEYLDAARQQLVREFVPRQLVPKEHLLSDLTGAWFERLNKL
jgi:Ser/Thr protein kinase RdoA (MazF antagonist)